MNILYLIPSLKNSGGMERILTEKANFLSDIPNYKVFIGLTEMSNDPNYFDLNPKVNVINFELNFNSFFNLNILEKYLKTKRALSLYKTKLEETINNFEIDICISLGGKELEFFYKIDTRCKLICELHFSQNVRQQFYTSRSSSLFWRAIGYIRTKQLIQQTRYLDKLVVLTQNDFVQWKKTNKNVLQIYNFASIIPDQKSSLDTKTVIAVGRLDPQKGFDILIDVWRCLKKIEENDWELNIYGEGNQKIELNNKIIKYKLESSVHLRGASSDITNELLRSSIFVLSSRYEGFPMVLLESLSCGVPIVSFDCRTGPSEIIKDNDCGYLIEEGNVESMAKKIIFLMNDEQERIRKGNIALEKSKFFSKDKIMNQWIKLFEDVSKK